MFHALFDQLQGQPSLKDYADSHHELRFKLVCEGYSKFLETEKLSWPDDPECGSKKNWKRKMLDPSEYGDEIILHLASNLLEVEIILIPAFRESGCNPVRGITKIQPMLEPRNDPFYLFAYSDSDFISPHYESVWPKDPTFPPTFLPSSILPPSIAIDDTEMLGEI